MFLLQVRIHSSKEVAYTATSLLLAVLTTSSARPDVGINEICESG